MKTEGVKAEVYGRPKHIYSIWRKMQKKQLAFDELFDVRAVRIVAERLQDCYAALGIVHTHYRHLPDEFDDYVANPKPNGYQSIHTVVLGPGGKTIEIQIRTKQMHEDAELGVAAHWKYKEGTASGAARSGHEDRIAWLRKLIARQEEMADSGEMLDEVRSGSLMTACMSLRRKATLWICLQAPRRSILLTTFIVMWGIVALARKLVDASYRLPTNCRWAIKLKLSPRNSQTQAATG